MVGGGCHEEEEEEVVVVVVEEGGRGMDMVWTRLIDGGGKASRTYVVSRLGDEVSVATGVGESE